MCIKIPPPALADYRATSGQVVQRQVSAAAESRNGVQRSVGSRQSAANPCSVSQSKEVVTCRPPEVSDLYR